MAYFQDFMEIESSLQLSCFGANRKHICNFLLVTSSNLGHVSYRFRDIDA